jgi:phosphoglucomutase
LLPAGNGIKKVIVGQHGFMATPAMSALIRRRSLYGGLIMSASHNPAGPDEDWGIKFNYSSGEPAPEKITNEIFKFTESVTELKMAEFPDVDLDKVGTTTFGDFEVEVVCSRPLVSIAIPSSMHCCLHGRGEIYRVAVHF